jgi:hypothetical protein
MSQDVRMTAMGNGYVEPDRSEQEIREAIDFLILVKLGEPMPVPRDLEIRQEK